MLVVTGCGSYCPPNRHIRDRVDDSAVVGTWHLTEESLRNLERDGFRRDPSHLYTITFKADHTCQFASFSQYVDTYIAAPCAWRLEHDVNDGSRPNQLQIEIQSQTPHGDSLNFAREDGVLILWQYYSDPDLWQFLEYKKGRV